MKLNDSMEDTILKMTDLQEAIVLLKAYALQETTPAINAALQKGVWGVNVAFHYKHYTLNHLKLRCKEGIISIAGQDVCIEELWEEMDNRLAAVKQALLTLLQDEDIAEEEWHTPAIREVPT